MSKVLVVDDSATVRNDVTNFLQTHGIETGTASDGAEAFEILSTDTGFRLALVDVNMPVMDGLTLVEKIKDELQALELSCIMLTTEFQTELKERGRAAGVRGWIVKPFNGEKALVGIKKLLG